MAFRERLPFRTGLSSSNTVTCQTPSPPATSSNISEPSWRNVCQVPIGSPIETPACQSAPFGWYQRTGPSFVPSLLRVTHWALRSVSAAS
ncbi:hypothetical protein [Polyangium sp. 15x6]|uniref:hypothetical protein n=1 Tax=Polyangium sp. 15x6 TaxID=3042687 RepID=UPI00249AA3C2|nr:hypothetical protein [Polyangium sp. 15x6]MDI3289273.1 hypothetical protein [Polyangium sp. 15x6]